MPNKKRKMPALVNMAMMTSLAWVVINGSRCTRDKADDHPTIKSFAQSLKLDQTAAQADLAAFTKSPHPFGSNEQGTLQTYLQNRLKELGFSPLISPFSAEVPNPVLLSTPESPAPLTLQRSGANILAFAQAAKEAGCVVLIGSHYDSKQVDGISYLGANDSASSSLMLLQLLKAVHSYSQSQGPLACDLLAIWFDGEESVLPEWSDGKFRHPAKIDDHTYGSRHEAGRLKSCENELCLPDDLGGHKVKSLILFDMIGSPNPRLSRDSNSTRELLERAAELAGTFYGNDVMSKFSKAIDDDHVPYGEKGLKVLDVIDFENLSHWHKASDTPSNISLESVEKALRLGTALVLEQAAS